MRITIVCYRKAYPQEILTQLEPVLREAGFDWKEIIALFRDKLQEKGGFQVFEIPDDPSDPFATDDIRFLQVLNEWSDAEGQSKLPAPQVLQSAEIMRYNDGTYRQGFRLHSQGLLQKTTVATLFVPDYNKYDIGVLVECHYDKESGAWRPAGEERRVVADWKDLPAKPSKSVNSSGSVEACGEVH